MLLLKSLEARLMQQGSPQQLEALWNLSVPSLDHVHTVFQCTMPSTVSLNVLRGCHAGIQKDKYLEPMLQPTDEAEMAERLKHRLTGQAPPAFTSLIGRSTYQKGMRDIHDMLQLPTFVTQIGYGVLEIGVLALYPELRDFFSRIHRDGAAPSGCNADSTS